MAGGITIRWFGTNDLIRRILAAEAKATLAGAAALYVEGQRIMAESARLVPVDTGALRASGYVRPPAVSFNPEVVLGYGGSAAPYAVFVHEDLLAQHPVGQAKYLEQPVLEAAAGLGKRLAATMRLSI